MTMCDSGDRSFCHYSSPSLARIFASDHRFDAVTACCEGVKAINGGG
jgi:hypothetical protein